MPSEPMQTRFFELAGAHAVDSLRMLGDALRRQGARVTLLASRDQTDLYLLVAEARPLPETTLPEGVRTWTFERLAV